ncbi:hypothetical protein LGR54_11565 [Ancylobacter sp. Lp-2]|uniref:hypothetical protein n=1 Tax=Ancylobacter sp. Lp-2 TaxID=2881339 RepID=UPI001E59645E|nr:hypothetical protein [Ancylobacter sp. Lp-2]MCB4769243.1 hypothetical protein [Ancylobacter sp. Lp-2]
MTKAFVIGSIAALMALTAIFVGGASATGYFRPTPVVNTVELPLDPIAGDCVVQTRWVSDAGQMRQVERAVCY